MTVEEMHIAVNLGVQKIASFQADNLLPQEIDHELNLATLRFIKQRYNPTSNRQGKGFEQSQKRIDDLRTLIVDAKGDTSNIGDLQDNWGRYMYSLNNSNIYIDQYQLPVDYMFLVSVKALIKSNCRAPIPLTSLHLDDVNSFQVKINLTPPQEGFKITAISTYDSVNSQWVQITTGPLGEPIEFADLYYDNTYINGIKPSYSLVSEVNASNVTATDPVVNSNELYLWQNAAFASIGGAFVRTTWVLNGDMSNSYYVYSMNQTSQSTKHRNATVSESLGRCIFVQNDDLYVTLEDPFNTTCPKLVLYTIEESNLNLYTTNEFVVPEVHVRYVRKPRKISITDGVGCDLPDYVHPEIIEMAIKSILEGVESPRYQSQSMETFESE